MEYRGGLANAGAGVPVTESTRLNGQINDVDSIVDACFSHAGRLREAHSRLVNPRPSEAAKSSGNLASPGTIEGRLQGALSRLQILNDNLAELANDYDRAI